MNMPVWQGPYVEEFEETASYAFVARRPNRGTRLQFLPRQFRAAKGNTPTLATSIL